MQKVILNIPHSGTEIPDWARKDLLIGEAALAQLVDFMTDQAVDRLWEFAPEDSKQVASLSRLVVDTERYRNDAAETMHQKGMGLYYTHTPEGVQFRRREADTYARCLAQYDAYHSALEEKVAACLGERGKCILLDCHSFHDGMTYTGHDPGEFPDVCIGVNGNMTEEAQLVRAIFAEAGYTVKVNVPFSGSLVPLKYRNDDRVRSVMIELNRRIYEGEGFGKVQSLCGNIYRKLNGQN